MTTIGLEFGLHFRLLQSETHGKILPISNGFAYLIDDTT